jgi:hypothetical protein
MMTKKHIEMLSTASPEELARVEELSGDAIAKALQQGREERREAEACESPGPADSRVLFRRA